MAVAVSPANIVSLTLQSIQDYLDGKDVEKEQNIELAVVDASNIADYMKYVEA